MSAAAPERARSTSRRVGIVGLGVIGGSLARDLAGAGWHVAGADSRDGTLAAAREAGAVAEALRPGSVADLDLLVLAVPVGAACRWIDGLRDAVPPDSNLVLTDTGSTKRSVARAAERAGLARRFVGGHPMAGSHRSGWVASRERLFDGADVWICPGDAPPHAVAAVEALWRTVGAHPRRTHAAEHDRLLACTSHLPQATASALAATLARHDVPRSALGPGGRDTTRLAASDPDLWTEILLDNHDHVAAALDALAGEARALGDAVRARDRDAVRAALVRGRAWTAEPGA